jgi:hypothetical protein
MPSTSTLSARLHRKPVHASPAQVEVAYSILKDLPHHLGIAIRDFYTGASTEADICNRAGVTPEEFRALRARIRAEFFSKTA